jgi:hypothetical protein
MQEMTFRGSSGWLGRAATAAVLAAASWSGMGARGLPVDGAATSGAASGAKAGAKAGGPDQALPPRVRIEVGPLGYMPPSKSYVTYGFSLATLDFIDADHLLFTFRVHSLMKRIPDDPGNDDDQTIRAEVIEIASGKVLKQADWRMHDRARYLWPLKDGRFLVRQRNSLFLTDRGLELRPYMTFENTLDAVHLSPGRGLMLIEVEKLLPPEDPSANSGPSPGDTPAPATRRKRVELSLLHPGETTPIAETEVPRVIDMALFDDGFLDIKDGPEHNQWAITRAPFHGKPGTVGFIRSTCKPSLQPLSDDVVLAEHCSPNRTLGDREVTVLSVTGAVLWRDHWAPKYILPSFDYAQNGSRFAYESLEVNREIVNMQSFGDDDVVGQPVGVFDTLTGKLDLVRDATPVLTGGHNFALSADGRQFAILRDGAIEIYDLPPVEAPTAPPAKKK